MTQLPKKYMLERVLMAARLRAAGKSWLEVSQLMHYSVATCMGWPERYPKFWAFVMRRIQEERYWATWAAFEESARGLLREADRRIRLRAAAVIEQAAARYPGVLSPTTIAEAELVRARDAAGPVRVVRVTAKGPAAGPAPAGPVRCPAPVAPAAPVAPPAAAVVRAAALERRWDSGTVVGGLLIGLAVLILGVLLGAGVMEPAVGVALLALVGVLVWGVQPGAGRR